MKFCLLFVIGVSAIALSAGRRDHQDDFKVAWDCVLRMNVLIPDVVKDRCLKNLRIDVDQAWNCLEEYNVLHQDNLYKCWSNIQQDHGPHGNGHSDGSYEIFDSSRENSRRLCESGFLGCITPFYKYDKHSFNETLDLIRSTGAQEICREVLEAKSCAEDNLAEPVCHNIPSYAREHVNRMFNFIDYTCTDKFTELEKHWNCVTNIDVFGQIDRCEHILKSWTLPCNDTVAAFKTCFIDGVNSYCESGSAEYAFDLLNRAHPFHFNCRGRPNMKAVESLKNFWNRK